MNFETKIFYKSGGAALLEKQLRKPEHQCAPIALGVNTDVYQSAEQELGVTRAILCCTTISTLSPLSPNPRELRAT